MREPHLLHLPPPPDSTSDSREVMRRDRPSTEDLTDPRDEANPDTSDEVRLMAVRMSDSCPSHFCVRA